MTILDIFAIFIVLITVFTVVGLKNYMKISVNSALAIIVGMVFFLVLAGITLQRMSPHYTRSMIIEVTGEQNPEALGCDVGIQSIKFGMEKVDLSDRDLIGGWKGHQGKISWNYSENRTKELRVPIYAATKITFTKNLWGGIIKVTVNDHTEIIDLYSPNETTYFYEIERASDREIIQKLLPLVGLLFLEVLVSLWFMRVMFLFIPLRIYKNDLKKKNILSGLKRLITNYPSVIARIVIIGIFAFTMLYFADDWSLWADDIATIEFVSQEVGLKTICERIWSDVHSNTPLFYIIAFFWLRIVPYGTVYLKAINIIFCCVGIWFCGESAKLVKGERAGIICVAVASTSYYLAQHAALTFRCYGLLFLISSLAILTYNMRLQRPDSKSLQVLYGVILCLLLYVHYYGLLAFGILGLFDLCLFLRKKIKFSCAFAYFGSFLLFVPYCICALSSIAGSIKSFWATTPNLTILYGTFQEIFDHSNILLLLFLIGVCLTLLSGSSKRVSDALQNNFVMNTTVAALICWVIFIFAVSYIFSTSNFMSSIFVDRYFVSVFAPAMVVVAVALESILQIVGTAFPHPNKDIVATVVIMCCVIPSWMTQISALHQEPGTIYQPYEYAIDWIYEHPSAHKQDGLVMMTGYQGGLYYYGTHGGQRENLNFGMLNSENWEKFNTVFISEMHGAMPEETADILKRHFGEVERDDELRVVRYVRTG